jgi:hypothetical protein
MHNPKNNYHNNRFNKIQKLALEINQKYKSKLKACMKIYKILINCKFQLLIQEIQEIREF